MGDLLGDIVSGAGSIGSSIVSGAQSIGGSVMSSFGGGGSGAGGRSGDTAPQQSDNQGGGIDWVSAGVGAIARGASAINPLAGAAAGVVGTGLIAADTYFNSKPQNDAGVSFKQPTSTTKSGFGSGSSKDTTGKSGGVDYTIKYAKQQGPVTANWREPISNRPGYRNVEDLGLDRKTWSLISEGYSPLQAVDMRIQEETIPSVKRELDWQRSQLAENKVEVSSDYHHWALDTGKPTAINPFENEGDMALALLQGTRQEGRLQIAGSNPSASGLFADLPGGKGLNDISWESAQTGFTQRSPSFTKVIDRVEAAKNYPGVYGYLNANRDYTDWNKSHPGAQVTVVSPMDLLTGTVRSKKIPATQQQDYYYAGYTRGKYKPPKSELSVLREAGLVQPFSHPKIRNKPLGEVNFSAEHGSFQTMRKSYTNTPKKKGVATQRNESELLREMGLLPGKTSNKTVQNRGKPKNSGKKAEHMFWGI